MELRDLMSRSREGVLLAAIVGLVTGIGVAGFEWLSIDVLADRIGSLPLWVVASAPGVGLALAAIALRVGGRLSPSTSDEYIRNMHASDDLALPPLPWRMAAAIFTLGTGNPGGLEGPSLYLGSGIGTAAQHRFRRYLTDVSTKSLMVAGAAAGVAAVFKAPATGAVFAIEVPYRDDLGRRLLIPAMVGAATGYLGTAIFNGTTPLFTAVGNAPFDVKDLLGALVLGVTTGLFVRVFALMLRRAKQFQATCPTWIAVSGGAAVMAGIVVAGQALFGEDLVLRPGYDAIRWATDPSHAVGLVVALLVLRVIGVTTVVGSGGVIGLFIPLVVTGALFGRTVGGVIGAEDLNLFGVIGVAAGLGAGYRVPLAAVMFVAETTGRASYVIPGLIAAVGADLVMGRSSVTTYQR
jgi:CIC family chloride channel protein